MEHRYLFLDLHHITRIEGLYRRMHQPQRHPDNPNQVDFEGSTENNLVDIGRTNCEGAAIIYDEHETDPARRYKAFYWEHGGIDTFVA